MFGYVYITTNLINGRKYIGKHQSSTLDDDGYLGSGVYLKNAVKKYGKKNFCREIIYCSFDAEDLEKAELDIIIQNDAARDNLYYNVSDTKMPAGNGNKDFRHSNESKEKIKISVRKSRERILSERSSYHTPEGLSELKRKVHNHWTEERRASHSALLKSIRHNHLSTTQSNRRYADLPNMLKTMTVKEIAVQLGVSSAAIRQRVKRQNIKKIRDISVDDRINSKRRSSAALAHVARRQQTERTFAGFDLREMYKTMTQTEMAKIIGVSQVRVSQYLRELGITKPK